MPPETIVAVVTAAGVVIAALVSVFFPIAGARGALSRMETISRVLQMTDEADPAHADLIELRRIEATELLRVKKSPERFILGIYFGTLVWAALVVALGPAVLAWSPIAYLVAAYIFSLLAVVSLTLTLTVAIAFLHRVVRKALERRQQKQAKRAELRGSAGETRSESL